MTIVVISTSSTGTSFRVVTVNAPPPAPRPSPRPPAALSLCRRTISNAFPGCPACSCSGIIQRDYEICLRRRVQPLLDNLPGRHQVGKGDYREIVHQRRPKRRRRRAYRRHAGDYLQIKREPPTAPSFSSSITSPAIPLCLGLRWI